MSKFNSPQAASLLFLLSIVILTACGNSPSDPGDGTVTPQDSLAILREAFDEPEKCQGCHPAHYQEWSASMHAYAFVDPTFFALNDIGQQRSNQQLDQFCVKCHSPVASLLKETPPGFDPLSLTDIAQKGVQCDVCHTISSFEKGRGISTFRLDKVKQGPIPDPQANSFHESEFDSRYNKSNICSACHDVLSPDDVAVEFTSTEWETSPYTAMGFECQGCHMPTYSGQAAIGGPVREVHRHTFIGVDIPLIDFPGRENTITLVDELLKNSVTMTVTAPAQISAGEDLTIQVKISNDRTGHNVPTGTIFERQMWLEIIARDATNGDVIYSSGTLDENGDLLNQKSSFVKSGMVSEDTDLALFNGTPLKNGEEVPFFWEADSIENKTIPPFSAEIVEYKITGPLTAKMLDLSVRLRFRSFPPYFLRAIDQSALIENLVTFDMQNFSQPISVN